MSNFNIKQMNVNREPNNLKYSPTVTPGPVSIFPVDFFRDCQPSPTSIAYSTSTLFHDDPILQLNHRLPVLCVGVLMERPEINTTRNNHSYSWGLTISKELPNHALIVGVNPTKHKPKIKFCRITDRLPSPLIVYNSKKNEVEYESFFVERFPPSWRGQSVFTNEEESNSIIPSLSAAWLQPGDAIISINGITVSSFESTSSLASFIRQNCQNKILIVALRHYLVWKAAWTEITNKFYASPSLNMVRDSEHNQQQQISEHQMRCNLIITKQERVTKAIYEAWKNLLIQIDNKDESCSAKRRLQYPNSSLKISKTDTSPFSSMYSISDTRQLVNEAFHDKNGRPLCYCDNSDYDPDDGSRLSLFVTNDVTTSFDEWLKQRKIAWKKIREGSYLKVANARKQEQAEEVVCHDFWISMKYESFHQWLHMSQEKWRKTYSWRQTPCTEDGNESVFVPHDFWQSNGYNSFSQWLYSSKQKWRRSYSWRKDRRIKLQSVTEKEVHFPSMELLTTTTKYNVVLAKFLDWLRVRKQQWQIDRRKRQIRLSKHVSSTSFLAHVLSSVQYEIPRDIGLSKATITSPGQREFKSNAAPFNNNIVIDEFLEDQETQLASKNEQHLPVDIHWIFDSSLGAPDDVVVVLMRFLKPSDHVCLLCLSKVSNALFKKRDSIWQSLCHKHWILPRRPRKCWCTVYTTKILAEDESSRKRSDDLLMKASLVIEKGDQLNKFEKLVQKAENDFGFDVNYTSGVVIERNSLLNIAVINCRHKIVKWLIDVKHADIETCDRGDFTPLLNAAWNGDRCMVRYLLGRGSDRRKIGTFHSSKGVAPTHFQGLNAEGWARDRGHIHIAELIRLGL